MLIGGMLTQEWAWWDKEEKSRAIHPTEEQSYTDRRYNSSVLFNAIAGSFYLYQRSMMNEAINDGRGKGSVIVQGFTPVAECAVGGNDHGTAFIAIGDDLKEQFGALLVHG